MTSSPATSNITSTTNGTVDFDFYCNEMVTGSIIWAAFSFPCAAVGFPASAWLLWVLVQRQRSGSTNDVYMLNLTVMDVIFNLYVVPAMFNYIVWENQTFTHVDNFLYCFNMTGRPLFMACICVDCFLAVVYPVTYMKMKRSRYRWLTCAAVWCYTFTFGIAIIIEQEVFVSSASGIPYFLSVPTIVACDIVILRTLRKPDPSGRSDVHPQKQRALQTITTSLVMTLVSYLPVLIVCPFLSLMRVTKQVKMCVIMVPILVAPLIGSVVMPLLQLHSLGRLRGLQQCPHVSGSSGQAA